MGDTSIEWTDATWNPVRGCSRVSPGCENCYAERVAARFSKPGLAYEGLARMGKNGPRWTGYVEFVEDVLRRPLSWREPRRVFVNSMSDLFHERLADEQIAAVFGVMAATPQHTYQVLTKRAERMGQWFRWAGGEFTDRQRGIAAAPNTARAMLDAAHEYIGPARLQDAWHRLDSDGWPLPNVWLGVSAEDQERYDDRWPHLAAVDAAVRFVSYEPALGELDFGLRRRAVRPDWIIVGGESGHGARPFDVEWARWTVRQCRDAGVACFVKQLGAFIRDRNDAGWEGDEPGAWPMDTDGDENLDGGGYQGAPVRVRLSDRKGGDPSEWPENLRVRQWPGVAHG